MRVVAAQIPMAPTVTGNLARVFAAVRAADADLVVFPECTLTGFHRGLPELLQSRDLAECDGRLRRLARETGKAVLVGRPMETEHGVLNVVQCFAPGQPVQWVAKVGLTPSETRFFSAPLPGSPASAGLLRVGSLRLGVVLCREVLDAQHPRLVGADLIVWPGYIQWTGDGAYLDAAKDHCRSLRVPMLQCNWATSLNAPDTVGMGGSVALDANGGLVAQAAMDCADTLQISVNLGHRASTD